jgi:hypothetical protein
LLANEETANTVGISISLVIVYHLDVAWKATGRYRLRFCNVFGFSAVCFIRLTVSSEKIMSMSSFHIQCAKMDNVFAIIYSVFGVL